MPAELRGRRVSVSEGPAIPAPPEAAEAPCHQPNPSYGRRALSAVGSATLQAAAETLEQGETLL